jgi:ribosomal protein S18 acetylase RimI-like enzyme
VVAPAPARTSRAAAVVRDLRWEDFPALQEAYLLLYDERDRGEPHGIHLQHDRPSPADEVTWFAGLYRRFLLGESVVVVAEAGGRAVGSCTVSCLGPGLDAEMGHVGVLGILVHRDHRGSGIGTALLEAALARCRGRFEIVRLSVHSTNPRARRLYERFGFRTVGAIPRAIRRGGEAADEVLMVLDLGGARTAANR